MTIPADAPAWLRDILTELSRAQVRSEERFAAVEAQLTRLSAAQERSELRLDRIDERLDRLAAAQEQMAALLAHHDERLDRLAATQEQIAALLRRHDERFDRIDDRLGRLTGLTCELRVLNRAPRYLGGLADRVQLLTPVERDRLIDPAVRNGRLTRDQARYIRLADFLGRGADSESEQPCLLVVEVSARVAQRDVERAAARARLLDPLGTPVLAAVVGQRIDWDAQTAADAAGVRQLIYPDE